MLLRQRKSGHMVEVMNVIDLVNLNRNEVTGRFEEGEESQDADLFKKEKRVFF